MIDIWSKKSSHGIEASHSQISSVVFSAVQGVQNARRWPVFCISTFKLSPNETCVCRKQKCSSCFAHVNVAEESHAQVKLAPLGTELSPEEAFLARLEHSLTALQVEVR